MGRHALTEATSVKDYVGRTRRRTDEVTLGAVRRMAATLDQDPNAYRRGSEMPESWYVILFGPTALERTLAGDGHVMTGDFLPPLHNARRMFGGRRVRFHQPLRDRRSGRACFQDYACRREEAAAAAHSR